MACVATGVGGGVCFCIGRGGGFLTIIVLTAGGGVVEALEEFEEYAGAYSLGRGAIGIAISTVLLYAGYPSQCLPDLTHFIHCGRVSSHLTLRFLRVEPSAHAPTMAEKI